MSPPTSPDQHCDLHEVRQMLARCDIDRSAWRAPLGLRYRAPPAIAPLVVILTARAL
jgi:hypothetical protein